MYFTNKKTTAIEEERQGATTKRQSGGPKARPGLSNGHIRPQYNKNHDLLNADVEYYPEGQLIKIKTPWMYKNMIKCDRKKRGRIKNFSRRSRVRLQIRMSQVKKIDTPVFVTLTYPSEFPSMMESKKDLRNFIKRLKRKYHDKDLGYLWRLELQKRGAPHFHLFIWGVQFHDLLKTIPEMWFEVVGSEDIKHYAAGTRVEKIRSGNGISCYVSKYIAKVDEESEEEESIGRMWGYGGKIPFSECETRKITRRQAFTILRYLRRRIQFNNESIRHFIVSYPEFWLENHERITGDTVNF